MLPAIGASFTLNTGQPAWQAYELNVVGTGSSPLGFLFTGTATSIDAQSPVQEPTTYGMLVQGSAALKAARRYPLNSPSGQSEIRGGSEHVPIIGPHFLLSHLLRRRQMDRVGRPHKHLSRTRNHPHSGSPQERLAHRKERPQASPRVLGESSGQLNRFPRRRPTLADTPMQHPVKLTQGPNRRVDLIPAQH